MQNGNSPASSDKDDGVDVRRKENIKDLDELLADAEYSASVNGEESVRLQGAKKPEEK